MVKIYVLLAILLFGALVAVHEFGHFMTAKLSGVRVNEFSIGMGPAIFKKKKGETLYSLRIFPFGGFCAMEGEDTASDDPKAFGKKPVLSRILIVVAGSGMNLIAGFLVLALFFAPVKEWNTPTVESVGSDIPQNENMLMPGDVIKSVDDYDVILYNDIFIGMSRGGEDGVYDIEVLRNGKLKMLSDIRLSGTEGEEETEKNEGTQISFKKEKTSLFGKTRFVFKNGVNIVRLVIVSLSDLLSGAVSKDDVSGPVGIGKLMVDTAKVNFFSLWYLLAFLSINLGVMNLLPFPALDGGRLVFLLFELVFRKPVPQKYEALVHALGLAFLLLVMVLVTYNDIVSLFTK